MKSLMVILWEKMLFWNLKKHKKFKENIDYKFHNFPDTDLTGIEILRTEYAGIVYYYTYASVSEDINMANLKFGYHVVKSMNYDKNDLNNDAKFVTMLGDILTELILTEKQIEPTRTLYSEESDI